MPRKKSGVKKSTANDMNGEDLNGEKESSEKESSENGVEKEKEPVVNHGRIDKHDTNSVDSKSSGSSSVSIKKRFSFGKRKKNLDHLQGSKMSQDINGANQNGDLRRTNSLNNFNQDGSRSKIPILKHKRQHVDAKHGSKNEISPRLQKHGNYESRSLVLNPGMDSWRMAGLMDTVGNTNSIKTLNSINSISENIYKPPNIALCSGLSKDTVKSPEKVKADEPSNHAPEKSPVVNGENGHANESEERKETIDNQNHVNGFDNHNSSQLHDDKETEHMMELTTNSTSHAEVVEHVTVEAPSNCGSAPCDILKESEEVNDNTPSNVVVLTESVTTEPLHIDEEITEDIFCAGIRPKGSTSSDNECAVIDVPATSDSNDASLKNETVNGGIEHTLVQELYELDDDNVISVRKLRDLIIESQIQMPKEVCCDDWLVLDFSHSAIVSS